VLVIDPGLAQIKHRNVTRTMANEAPVLEEDVEFFDLKAS
jgi:hypothetical protein